MKNKKLILISLGISILFSLVTYQIIRQHMSVSRAKTPEEEVARAFMEFKKALKDRDIHKLWEGMGKYAQRGFDGAEERFKARLREYLELNPDYAKHEHEVYLDKVQMITPYRAWLVVHHPMLPKLKQYYMVKEDGKWKKGGLQALFIEVNEATSYLDKLLRKYYADKNHLPYHLSELVPEYIASLPLDPFSDENETYHYDATGDKTWRMYSVGLDSRDDLGLIKYEHMVDQYFVEFDNGDIVVEGSI